MGFEYERGGVDYYEYLNIFDEVSVFFEENVVFDYFCIVGFELFF